MLTKNIYSQPKSLELCLILQEVLGRQAQKAVCQVTLRELLQGGDGGS